MLGSWINWIRVDSKHSGDRAKTRKPGCYQNEPQVSYIPNETHEGSKRETKAKKNSDKTFNSANIQFHMILLKVWLRGDDNVSRNRRNTIVKSKSSWSGARVRESLIAAHRLIERCIKDTDDMILGRRDKIEFKECGDGRSANRSSLGSDQTCILGLGAATDSDYAWIANIENDGIRRASGACGWGQPKATRLKENRHYSNQLSELPFRASQCLHALIVSILPLKIKLINFSNPCIMGPHFNNGLVAQLD